MPCLNEAENVQGCVREAYETLASNDISGEVIVVDNGSTDGSASLALQAGATVIHEPRRGYGSAYLAGLHAARGQQIVMADCDSSYDLRDIPRFLTELDRGADFAIGDRMGGIHPGAMPWLHRRVGNPLMSGMINLLFATGVRDAWCGMRAMRRDAVDRLSLSSPGMEFAIEMVIRARQHGLVVHQLPIELHPRGGESKLSTFRDGWRALKWAGSAWLGSGQQDRVAVASLAGPAALLPVSDEEIA
jgi:glycosyltransferase involved in cell wall biosynthesis